MNKLREVFERAVTASGTAVRGGDKIWVAFRVMETGLVTKATNKKEEKQARERVLKLYRRQLSLPLEGNDGVMRELEEQQEALGCDATTLSTARSLHKDAMKLLEKREALEEQLGSLDGNESDEIKAKVVSLWQEYVALEEGEGQVARLPGLYERALARCCSSPTTTPTTGGNDASASMTVEGWAVAEPLWLKYG